MRELGTLCIHARGDKRRRGRREYLLCSSLDSLPGSYFALSSGKQLQNALNGETGATNHWLTRQDLVIDSDTFGPRPDHVITNSLWQK